MLPPREKINRENTFKELVVNPRAVRFKFLSEEDVVKVNNHPVITNLKIDSSLLLLKKRGQ